MKNTNEQIKNNIKTQKIKFDEGDLSIIEGIAGIKKHEDFEKSLNSSLFFYEGETKAAIIQEIKNRRTRKILEHSINAYSSDIKMHKLDPSIKITEIAKYSSAEYFVETFKIFAKFVEKRQIKVPSEEEIHKIAHKHYKKVNNIEPEEEPKTNPLHSIANLLKKTTLRNS